MICKSDRSIYFSVFFSKSRSPCWCLSQRVSTQRPSSFSPPPPRRKARVAAKEQQRWKRSPRRSPSPSAFSCVLSDTSLIRRKRWFSPDPCWPPSHWCPAEGSCRSSAGEQVTETMWTLKIPNLMKDRNPGSHADMMITLGRVKELELFFSSITKLKAALLLSGRLIHIFAEFKP